MRCVQKIKWKIKDYSRYLTTYHSLAVPDWEGVVLIFDPHLKHPGLLDRFKAIVGSFELAIKNGREFKILFDPESVLPKYVEPNGINWRIDAREVCYSPFHSRILDYYGEGDIPKLGKARQYHIYHYVGLDYGLSNGSPDWESEWSARYNLLFKPTSYLTRQLSEISWAPGTYIAVHIRFVNALGMLEPDYHQVPLPAEKACHLMDTCISKIKELEEESGLPALVFADSPFFLQEAVRRGLHIAPGEVGHISTHPADLAVWNKAFLDMYIISRAKRVFQIRGDALYASAFSYFSALIGGIHPEVVIL